MIELTLPALFATGLAASPHCALMCGALQVSMLHTRGTLPMARALVLLQTGRIAGYALLGAAAGGVGQWLLRDLPAAAWGRWIQVAAALLLVGLGVYQYRSDAHPRHPACRPPRAMRWLARIPAQPRMLLQGLAWAAMPCGLLYAMLGLAALSGSTLFGALLLAAFGLGASPLLTGSGALIAHVGGMQGLRRSGAAVLVAMGVAALVAGTVYPASWAAWCRLS
ncbi:MAG: sulfite exporter TauE/SafE family protein [Gammaproteobacteria bacterium]